MRDVVSPERRTMHVQKRNAQRWAAKMDKLEPVLRKWCELVQAVYPGVWYYRKNDHHAIVASEYVAVVARPDHEVMNLLAENAEPCQDWPMVTAIMVNATILDGTVHPDLNAEVVKAQGIMDAARLVLVSEGFAFYGPAEVTAKSESSNEGATGLPT